MGTNLKQVVLNDGGNEHYLVLTEDQIRLLAYMIDHGFFGYGEVTYTVLDEQEWKTI